MKRKILVVDDDKATGNMVQALEEAGCKVKAVATGEQAVRILVSYKPDVLITEIKLPGISGFSLLEMVAGEKAVRDTRVLVVTSDLKGGTLSKAFEKGAEDFLVKPFDIRELVTRVQVILRRMHPDDERDRISRGTLSLEPATRKAFLGEERIALTKIEFGMLLLFVQKAGRVLSRGFLLQYLWGTAAAGGTRTVDMHVANIRRKLGDMGKEIETIKGVGYLLPRR